MSALQVEKYLKKKWRVTENLWRVGWRRKRCTRLEHWSSNRGLDPFPSRKPQTTIQIFDLYSEYTTHTHTHTSKTSASQLFTLKYEAHSCKGIAKAGWPLRRNIAFRLRQWSLQSLMLITPWSSRSKELHSISSLRVLTMVFPRASFTFSSHVCHAESMLGA